MKDFTIPLYKNLLQILLDQHYHFQTFLEFIGQPDLRVIILRHDVDKLPRNALQLAQIEHEMGIKGTYYFRIVPESFNPKVIEKITGLEHEIGYHYEDISPTAVKQKAKGKRQNDGKFEKYIIDEAIKYFERNLKKLHEIAPVKTICMHGSPLSKWDSRLLWKYYDYRDFGIIGEPYFDINFSQVLYLTDTGRRWDGESVNVRDKLHGAWSPDKSGLVQLRNFISQTHKIPASLNMEHGENGYENWKVQPKLNSAMRMSQEAIQFQQQYNFRSTFDIIKAAEGGNLPDKIMLTFHPQRWTDKPLPWVKELVWQNVKNVGKYFHIKLRNI